MGRQKKRLGNTDLHSPELCLTTTPESPLFFLEHFHTSTGMSAASPHFILLESMGSHLPSHSRMVFFTAPVLLQSTRGGSLIIFDFIHPGGLGEKSKSIVAMILNLCNLVSPFYKIATSPLHLIHSGVLCLFRVRNFPRKNAYWFRAVGVL